MQVVAIEGDGKRTARTAMKQRYRETGEKPASSANLYAAAVVQ